MVKKGNEDVEKSLKELQREVKELREMVNFLVGFLMSMNALEDDDLIPQVLEIDSPLKNSRYSM